MFFGRVGSFKTAFVKLRGSIKTPWITTLNIRLEPWIWERGEELVNSWKIGVVGLRDDYPVLRYFSFIIVGDSTLPPTEKDIPVVMFVEDMLFQLPLTITSVYLQVPSVRVGVYGNTLKRKDIDVIMGWYNNLTDVEVTDFDCRRRLISNRQFE